LFFLCLLLSQDLCSKQVDFSNAFVQAKLDSDEHIYVAVPTGFAFGGNEDEETVLKLLRSLYGLVQAPLYWGNHLKDALEKDGLKQSVSDQCIYIGDNMVILTYVDEVLFFGKSSKKIKAKIKALEVRGFKLTVEEDIYTFLGVEVTRLPSGKIELKQSGLIAKLLATCGMTNCHAKAMPCFQEPLSMNPNGEPVTGKFDYASAVGMLMYLCSNTCPDIQYAVHQSTPFTHFPKKSHKDAITRICHYLQGTKEKGLRYKPDDELKLDCYLDKAASLPVLRGSSCASLQDAPLEQDPLVWKSKQNAVAFLFLMIVGVLVLFWKSREGLLPVGTCQAGLKRSFLRASGGGVVLAAASCFFGSAALVCVEFEPEPHLLDADGAPAEWFSLEVLVFEWRETMLGGRDIEESDQESMCLMIVWRLLMRE
jgi:Reverse transcriptase (RNA-dependent DNA polymerase)